MDKMYMIGNDGTIYFVLLLYIEVQKINRPKNDERKRAREKKEKREKNIDWLGKRISPSSHTLEKSRSIHTV